MSSTITTTRQAKRVNRRRHERFTLPAMYTAVCAHGCDRSQDDLHGHAYDISEGGVRFELDHALGVGQHISLDVDLPGEGEPFCAAGEVVWVNDEQDDPGPRRMALKFGRFKSNADRMRLRHYLGEQIHRAAA